MKNANIPPLFPHSPKSLSEVFLIQCKNLKVEKKLKREDAERLIKLAKQVGGTPLLAFNKNHKLQIIEVTIDEYPTKEYPHTVTYYNPPSLEDKQSK